VFFLPKQTQKQIFTELWKFNRSHLCMRFPHLVQDLWPGIIKQNVTPSFHCGTRNSCTKENSFPEYIHEDKATSFQESVCSSKEEWNLNKGNTVTFSSSANIWEMYLKEHVTTLWINAICVLTT
jgi:hypothetical protein